MSCSKGSSDACCPSAQVFQETICGNFSGGAAGVTDETVWSAPAGDYFEATFEIFNSSSSPDNAEGTVTDSAAATSTVGPVIPGFSVSNAVLKPVQFDITAPAGVNEKYCITLYKRVLP